MMAETKKKGLLIIALIAFVFSLYGQRPVVPLFLKGKNFDVVYEYNDETRAIVKSSYMPALMEDNFNDNTFYLKSDSITIDSSMQYEYFRMDSGIWLEVKTINKKSTLTHFKISEEIKQRDTVLVWPADTNDYSTILLVIPYSELDTLSHQSIIKKEIIIPDYLKN